MAGQDGDTTVKWELDASIDISDSDMIILVEAGSPADASDYITYAYASGEAAGSVDVSLGYYMEPGKGYEVRYVNAEYKTLASTVVGAGGSSVGLPLQSSHACPLHRQQVRCRWYCKLHPR